MGLTFTIDQEAEWQRINLSGAINEEAEIQFERLKKLLARKFKINFAKVTSINSSGTRAWINFLREVEVARTIVLEGCVPDIVEQINMIPSFKGMAKIDSVFGSFLCPECGERKLHLFSHQEIPKRGKKPTPIICECGHKMQFEDEPELYFDFAYKPS